MNRGEKVISEKALDAFMRERLLFAPHVDAYKYFLETQLPQIIGEHSPFKVSHSDVRLTRRAYYTSADHPLGEEERHQKRVNKAERVTQIREEAATNAEDGCARLEISMENIRISEPMYINSKGERVVLSVDRAIREGRSLNSNVIVDLSVTRIIQSRKTHDDTDAKSRSRSGDAGVVRETSVCKDFELFSIPRMIEYASTVEGVPAAGAFVVNGYLKVVQHQEYLSHNELHVRRVQGSNGSTSVLGQVRCTHTDWFTSKCDLPRWRSTSTLYFKVSQPKRTPTAKERDSPGQPRHPKVEVKVPYFTHPFRVADVLQYLEPDISDSYIKDRTKHARGPNPEQFDSKSYLKYQSRLWNRAVKSDYPSLSRPGSALESLLKNIYCDSDPQKSAYSDYTTSDTHSSHSDEDASGQPTDEASGEEESDSSRAQDSGEDPDSSYDSEGRGSGGSSDEDEDETSDDIPDDLSASDQEMDDCKKKRSASAPSRAKASTSKSTSPCASKSGPLKAGTRAASKLKNQTDSKKEQRPKRPPLPTPGVVRNFMKEFYPCAGPCPLAKRTMYLRHVDALLRAYHGRRSDTDRDSMKHRRVRTSGISLAHLVRQLFSTKMRTLRQLLSKNIDAANIDYVKKLMRQTCISKGIQFSMRGGAWGVKRSQKLKKGVCKMISTTNALAVLSETRQLKNPIMEEGKNPTPRQLHKDRFGLTCASESPEGKSVGLVNTLSTLGCIRTRPVAAWRLSMSILSPQAQSSKHIALIDHQRPFPDAKKSARGGAGWGWAVLANGIPFGRVKTSVRELYEAFRADRRDSELPSVPSTTGFSIWRQDREVRLSAEAGEGFRPLVRIRGGDRQNVAAKAASDLARIFVDRMTTPKVAIASKDGTCGTESEGRGRTALPEIPVRLQLRGGDDVKCYNSMYDSGGSCNTVSDWHRMIYEGPVEYITKSEESTVCIVRERLLDGNPSATHAELHPQAAIMGLSACGVPFANCNQSPRVLYGSAMRKQALGSPIPDPWIGSHSGFLCDPHRPLVNTSALRSLERTHGIMGSYCQAAVVAVLPLGGYNQEDSYVVSQGAVDRGLFFSCETTTRRAHEGQLGTSRIVFGGGAGRRSREAAQAGSEARGDSAFDSNGIRRIGAPVRGGETLVKRELQSRDMTPVPGAESGERKYSTDERRCRHDVRWNASDIEYGRVDGIAQWKTGNGGRTVRIRVAQVGPIGVGDKISSFHGQKGIIARILPDSDMPRTASGICPDLCINPHALPSRMTVGQLVELVAGKVACVEGAPVDGTPFSGQTLDDLMKRIPRSGYAGDYRGRELMYSGESGDIMGYVPVGIVSYMALRHRSFRKIQARGMNGRVNCVTKEATEGRRRAGGLRFGEMERDCLIAHGASAILRERLMDQSDGHVAQVCRRCGWLATHRRGQRGAQSQGEGPWCPACAASGSQDPGAEVVDVRLPYAMRVVYNNLAAQNIHMKLKVGVEPRLG